jgi:CheY-like chemotaxis protein
LLFERALAGSQYQMVPARSVGGAMMAISAFKPAAIVLDVRLHGQESWDVLARLKRDDATRTIPVVIASTIDDMQKGFALGADAYQVKPIARDWLLDTLDGLVPQRAPRRVLIVDDEETARFILRELLAGSDYQVVEASSGREGLKLAREVEPDVILVDLRLKDMTGVDLCEKLREDEATARLPLVMITSGTLTPEQRQRFGADRPVLSKSSLTRAALHGAIETVLTGAGPTAAHAP